MRIPLLLAAVLPLLAQNAEWPQFRGPGGTGIAASSAAPPVEFSPSQRLLWKQALPIGHSSPAVWGDRIFLTSFDPPSKKLELICVSSGNGAILWRRVAPAPAIEETHVVSNPATATPTVDEERVYAYFSSYGVMAFDHSGKSAWTAPLPMPKTHHGSGASPILAGDLLIINHDAMNGQGDLAPALPSPARPRGELLHTHALARPTGPPSRRNHRGLPGIHRQASLVARREHLGSQHGRGDGRSHLCGYLECSWRGGSALTPAGFP